MAQRKRHTAEFKAKACLAALREQKTVNEIAGELGVHPGLLLQWKKTALDALPGLFSTSRNAGRRIHESLVDSLYQQRGQLTCELEWLKKNGPPGKGQEAVD